MGVNNRRVHKNQPLLKIIDLQVTFHNGKESKTLLQGVNIDVQPGKVTLLTGKTGAGKTLTAMSIMRLLDNSSCSIHGKIYFNDVDLLQISEKKMQQFRGKKVAMMFQDPLAGFNPIMRLGKQIREALSLQQNMTKKQAKIETLKWIEAMHLFPPDKYYDAWPSEVSGGELQRLMLAHSLARSPKLLILDEPTSALDYRLKQAFIRLLLHHTLVDQMTVLIITHDLKNLYDLADYIYVLENGKIIDSYPTSSPTSRPSFKNTTQSVTRPSPSNLVKSKQYFDAMPHEGVKPVLDIRNLSTGYYNSTGKKINIVQNFNLLLYPGTCVGISGPSGIGKSTLARGIALLSDFTKGQILLEDIDLLTLQSRSLREHRKKIQMVWQNPLSSLNPHQNIEKTLKEAFKQRIAGEVSPTIFDLLEWVELDRNILDSFPNQISGGQQQRVCIARALALNPSVLICDEPVSSLDASTQIHILNLLKKLQRELNLAILFISHDEERIHSMANQLIRLGH